MRWIKKGHIFKAEKQYKWMSSHAQCPTPLILDDKIRIFFSSRLENQESLPTFIDIERSNPQKILAINGNPILERGRKGTFDENGIIPSCVIRKDKVLYLYYSGWSQCRNVPYKNFTGLAMSSNYGLSFTKHSEAPVFTLNQHNPLSATSPYVMQKDDNFIAFYSTGINWLEIEKRLEHTYLLTYATSKDAILWESSGRIIINPVNEYEAYCKPTVIEIGGVYHMWFSKRGSHNFRKPGDNSYRIGYAFSTDLINWNRDDSKAGIDISEEGWDSEMICYPNIVMVDNKYLMFYNGNGFGRTGFGYAELEF